TRPWRLNIACAGTPSSRPKRWGSRMSSNTRAAMPFIVCDKASFGGPEVLRVLDVERDHQPWDEGLIDSIGGVECLDHVVRSAAAAGFHKGNARSRRPLPSTWTLADCAPTSAIRRPV